MRFVPLPAALAAAGLGLIPAAPLPAAPCFCLEDQERTPYRDCVEVRSGVAAARIDCRLVPGQERTPVDGGTAMRRVPDGKPPACDPCRVVERGTGPGIRHGAEALIGNGTGSATGTKPEADDD